MNYCELFEKLESISGRKDKEKLIKENWSEELKQIFLRVYDYNRQSYTNKFIDFSTTDHNEIEDRDFKNIVELFDHLNEQGSASNLNKYYVWSYLDDLKNDLQYKWDKKILTKDLKIGVSEKTLNKLFEPFIPTFEVMLAKKVENIDELKFPLIVQPKLDGIRCLKVGKALIGRNGKAIANEKLQELLKNLIKEENYIFDGELYSHELTFNDILSQINSDSKELHPSIKYVVYDLLTKQEWEKQKCETNYSTRWVRIKSFVNLKQNCEWIGGIEVNNVFELKEYYEKCLSEDYEGVMVKSPEGRYEWKRVKENVMGKIKPSETFDCRIVDIKQGSGKYENNFGAFIVDFDGVRVNVGSGYSDLQRKEFWNKKELLINKWIEVKAQEKTVDGSLRFPIFLRIRDDK
jgi:DNA ligase-1